MRTDLVGPSGPGRSRSWLLTSCRSRPGWQRWQRRQYVGLHPRTQGGVTRQHNQLGLAQAGHAASARPAVVEKRTRRVGQSSRLSQGGRAQRGWSAWRRRKGQQWKIALGLIQSPHQPQPPPFVSSPLSIQQHGYHQGLRSPGPPLTALDVIHPPKPASPTDTGPFCLSSPAPSIPPPFSPWPPARSSTPVETPPSRSTSTPFVPLESPKDGDEP